MKEFKIGVKVSIEVVDNGFIIEGPKQKVVVQQEDYDNVIEVVMELMKILKGSGTSVKVPEERSGLTDDVELSAEEPSIGSDIVKTEFTIVLNGEKHLWKRKWIYYEQLIGILLNVDPGKVLSVTYKGKSTEGILTPTNYVLLEEGMVFNAINTGNA